MLLVHLLYFSFLLFFERVGKARSADFKSQPEGEAETSYLVEWTSLSYTPLTEFRLEVRREAGQWQEHSLPATEEINVSTLLSIKKKPTLKGVRCLRLLFC
jgi:hypothetical protein